MPDSTAVEHHDEDVAAADAVEAATAPEERPTTWRMRSTAWAILTLVACAFFLPRVDRPFGSVEINAGLSYGPFSRNWEKLGFFELRGAELGYTLVDEPIQGFVYMNHPPGVAWAYYLAGTSEAAMRIGSALVTLLGALVVFELARRFRLSMLGAVTAGCVYMLPRCQGVHAQLSLEPFVLLSGLGMLLLFEQRLRASATPRGTAILRDLGIAAFAFTGPWFDWSAWYFCVAVAVVAGAHARSILGWLRSMWLPASVSIASVGCIMAWRAWVLAADHLQKPDLNSVRDLFRTAVLETPLFQAPLTVYLPMAGETFLASFGPALLVVAGVGVVALVRERAAFTIALVIPGVLHPVLFSGHSINHLMFFSYLAPVIALAAGRVVAAGMAREWLGHPAVLRVAAVAAVTVVPAFESALETTRTSTTFYRDLGRVMTEAADGGRYNVARNLPHMFGYYVDTPRANPAFIIRTRAEFDTLMPIVQQQPEGTRMVWLRCYGHRAEETGLIDEDLYAILATLPRRRIAELETRFATGGGGAKGDFEIREAWLVTLKEPSD